MTPIWFPRTQDVTTFSVSLDGLEEKGGLMSSKSRRGERASGPRRHVGLRLVREQGGLP